MKNGKKHMITLRKSGERGHADHGWLKSKHTFSFADYHDPQHHQFRSLRVINEDWVAGGQGFGTHPHRDMEIITVVLEGALQHRDSMGNGEVLRPGEVQRMTAGTGIQHSEFNASPTEMVHLLQIWILPERKGLQPSYEQKSFANAAGPLTLAASRQPKDGAVLIHQDVNLFLGRFDSEGAVTQTLGLNRHAWVQVAEGGLTVNGVELAAGDGASVSGETQLEIHSRWAAKFLLFDLA